MKLSLDSVGAKAGAATAILVFGAALVQAMSAEPPLASTARVNELASKVAMQDDVISEIAQSLKQSTRINTATALTLYKSQLAAAVAAIEEARRAGRRDMIAESLKTNAEIAIMDLIGESK
jgi:uncharacterized coiled-coil protein SlyX